MSFNDFVHKYNLEYKATSIIKIVLHVLSLLSLNDVGIHLRDEPFLSDPKFVNLHPSKGTHWVCYINDKDFDSYRCSPPQKLSKFIIKRNRFCLFFEYQIEK